MEKILERVIVTVQTLAQQILALTEHRKLITSDPDPENIQALLKYLTKFDPVMRSHLDSVSHKSGCISYLSRTIQNEIISLLGERAHKYIITTCKLSLIHI